MKWEKVEPPSNKYGEYVLEEWRSGEFGLTVTQFTFGQRRVQAWGKEAFWCYPDPVGPST